MSRKIIEEQAMRLARENRRAEPAITKVFWFPDDEEVRLVELTPYVPPSGEQLRPFYFRPSSEDNLPAPSGIALIRPDEYRHVRLPTAWGSWDDAVELPANGEDQ